MKEYYAKRNNLLTNDLELNFNEVLSYFLQIYKYFDDKGSFNAAVEGIWRQIPGTMNQEQIKEPTLAPSPEIFFALNLQSKKVWPIWEYGGNYDEATLFSVIEILYDHIGIYNYQTDEFEYNKLREEFAEKINNILKAYKIGYYLEPTNGFIMKVPNKALKEQLQYNGEEMPATVFEQLATASEMYYRFDSNMEQKKKAINILADILENKREDLKEVLNVEYGIAKDKHDRLIFDIVNNYNIRHNRANQKSDYSKNIWYDWMMQYYTSVIIAFYRLEEEHSQKSL